jgi:murein peptide amidase A
MRQRVRDYGEVVHRLDGLSRSGWRVKQVGEVWNYPWFTVERIVKQSAPVVFLSGGMHGEEPAGVEGVLQWLERHDWARWRVNWFVLPCINPYGWERNQRTNAQRRDINRQFRHSSAAPEAELIKGLVKNKEFLFSMEFHEDVDAAGYYLYELRREPPFVGEKILRGVGKVIHINPDRIIDGRAATGRGLIRRQPDAAALNLRQRWPMAYHLFLNCTGHVLGSETPVTVPLEQRARAHQVGLKTALQQVLGSREEGRTRS